MSDVTHLDVIHNDTPNKDEERKFARQVAWGALVCILDKHFPKGIHLSAEEVHAKLPAPIAIYFDKDTNILKITSPIKKGKR
jgi:hypothetical protein